MHSVFYSLCVYGSGLVKGSLIKLLFLIFLTPEETFSCNPVHHFLSVMCSSGRPNYLKFSSLVESVVSPARGCLKVEKALIFFNNSFAIVLEEELFSSVSNP